MKVLDLNCQHGHVFEGWFASEDDFQSQKARALVQCPMCGDARIEKRLSAPRLNLGAQAPAAGPAPQSPGPAPAEAAASRRALQAAWLRASRELVAKSEDVGERFAAEARRMHHGETEARAIRGQATVEQAVELLEEGIGVMPLALAETAKKTLQ
ncbi:DUF1178 family protein [Comamonas antarctica]|uniref:DUF1178 family protein n=1 Tax=Comamonas antarctica TaxID=2743470 RepID=A0A6N1X3D2_9BURK|nr:DUF1178 family protein [Comamonas antarctica]QKV53954.1 DUF1178 family protein [Comamonas antarctica]